MEQWKMKMAQVMEIKDPRKAMVEMAQLVHSENLDLTVLLEEMKAYQTKHGVDADEMMFDENGERVLTEEMFL